MRLDHVAVEVSDIDAAIAFYKEVLGLRLLFKKADAEHGEVFAYFELEGGNLELLQQTGEDEGGSVARQPLRRSLCPHFALGVDSVDTAAQTLTERGVSILKGPLEIPGMVRWLYFTDPDGNIIEYVQWLNSAAASGDEGTD